MKSRIKAHSPRVLEAIGIVAITTGAALIHPAAGFVVGGALVIVLSYGIRYTGGAE